MGVPKVGSGALQGLQVASTGTESPVRKRIVTFEPAGTVAFHQRPVQSARPPAAMGADTSWPWELGVVYASWSRGRRVASGSSELEKPFCPMMAVESLTCRTMSPSSGTAKVHHAATRFVTFHPYQPVTLVIPATVATTDRKSTRLNSSHVAISYAVFCLKKKKNDHEGELFIRSSDHDYRR